MNIKLYYYLILFGAIMMSCKETVKPNSHEPVEEQKAAEAINQDDMIQEVMMQPSAQTPFVKLEIPLEKDALHAYLKEKAYLNYKYQETANHPSEGPHTQVGKPVRVYMNEILGNSIEEGNKEHPMGSISVKEMFDDANQLRGWAVMAKTADFSEYGQNWFWYETVNMEDPNEIVGMGNGVPLCVGCHILGTDMIRSHYPLK